MRLEGGIQLRALAIRRIFDQLSRVAGGHPLCEGFKRKLKVIIETYLTTKDDHVWGLMSSHMDRRNFDFVVAVIVLKDECFPFRKSYECPGVDRLLNRLLRLCEKGLGRSRKTLPRLSDKDFRFIAVAEFVLS